jgi:DNA-directed RNA polymerase subunit RPC12/RpoP
MLIKCNLFKYKCGKCGANFEAPVYLAGYGKFLLRSHESGEVAWLDAISSNAFKEGSELIKKHPKVINLKSIPQSNIVQDVIGSIYDKSAQGNHFGINVDPKCSQCGEQRASGYEEVQPSKLVEIDVEPVTSSRWDKLSEKEKKSLVDDLLSDY